MTASAASSVAADVATTVPLPGAVTAPPLSTDPDVGEVAFTTPTMLRKAEDKMKLLHHKIVGNGHEMLAEEKVEMKGDDAQYAWDYCLVFAVGSPDKMMRVGDKMMPQQE